MSSAASSTPVEPATPIVDLKNPTTAAVLAWVWPGAGHLYQGRIGKGLVFMICILGTFFYGMHLGSGRVVYVGEETAGAARGGWRMAVGRLPYLCQVWTGLPALPAILRARSQGNDLQPMTHWSNWYVPPRNAFELNELHKNLHRNFELGTVFTMIAGLLNVLAIYDAWGGPAYTSEERKDEEPKS